MIAVSTSPSSSQVSVPAERPRRELSTAVSWSTSTRERVLASMISGRNDAGHGARGSGSHDHRGECKQIAGLDDDAVARTALLVTVRPARRPEPHDVTPAHPDRP